MGSPERATIALASLLVAACPAPPPPSSPPTPIARPTSTPAPAAPREPLETIEPEEPLYPMDEALADALSGPLEHIGTGRWHGIATIFACAYRNQRVIVVNVYCTVKEIRAARVDVFSPTRGRVTIYAETETPPISARTRAEYFTFKGESEPAPAASHGLPPLHLDMRFADLQAYEKARYERFMAACWGGEEGRKPQGGCLHELAPLAPEFAARNQAFFAQPPEDWFRLIRELRVRAPADRKTAPAR